MILKDWLTKAKRQRKDQDWSDDIQSYYRYKNLRDLSLSHKEIWQKLMDDIQNKWPNHSME